MMKGWDHTVSRALFFWAKSTGWSRFFAILLARWWIFLLGVAVVAVALSGVKKIELLVLALIFGWGLNLLFGKLRTRKRPYTTHGYNALIPTWLLGGSFPSDHAMMSAVFGSLLILAGGVWIWVGIVLVVGVMVGRVMVGVHYPSDVLIGACIGFLSVYVASFLIFLF
ncbi:TPA: hypothetical protein DEB00_03265 [Candidatus Uhrbacteria bacterium]|nr:hypothetical protein [Candidatus Uhrbacteria bacterium]